MTLREIDHVSFLVEHAQTFFAGEPSHVGFHRGNSTVANIFDGLRIKEIIALKLHSMSFPHGFETQEKLIVVITTGVIRT